jgi:hypothetical protein
MVSRLLSHSLLFWTTIVSYWRIWNMVMLKSDIIALAESLAAL